MLLCIWDSQRRITQLEVGSYVVLGKVIGPQAGFSPWGFICFCAGDWSFSKPAIIHLTIRLWLRAEACLPYESPQFFLHQRILPSSFSLKRPLPTIALSSSPPPPVRAASGLHERTDEEEEEEKEKNIGSGGGGGRLCPLVEAGIWGFLKGLGYGHAKLA